MRTDLKDGWVAALESGDFKQVQNTLTKIEKGEVVGHCCLGVLAEICVRDFPDADVTVDIDSKSYRRYIFDGNHDSAALPHEWAESVGISVDDQNTLIGMNDNDNCTFTQIAQYVKENL